MLLTPTSILFLGRLRVVFCRTRNAHAQMHAKIGNRRARKLQNVHCSEHFAVCEHASVRIQLLLSKQFASTQACGYSCFSASVRIQLLLCKRADTAASLQARQTMFRPLNFVCEPRDGKVDVDEAYQLVLTMYIQINRQAPIDPPPRPLVLPKCCDIFRSC